MILSKTQLDSLRRRVTLLAGFSDEQILLVIKNARRRELRDGELIISEGTLSTKVYILISGGASVTRRVEDEHEEIAQLPVGATIGEMGIIDSSPRSARVSAKGVASVLEIDMDTFFRLPAEATSTLFRNLCRVLVKRLRGANTRIRDLACALPENVDLEALILEHGLVGLDLSDMKASGIAASRGEFRAALFDESDMSAADFSRSNLTGADFDSATMMGATFENANLSGAVFANVDFSGADFRGANLSEAIFDPVDDEQIIGEIGDDDESVDSSLLMRTLIAKPNEDGD